MGILRIEKREWQEGFTLHDREVKVKNYMERRVIPYLDDLFKRSNPQMYEMYQGNFCRQAAIYGNLLLQELLPEYQWSSWEALFHDKLYGQETRYEHAWIFGQHKEKDRNLLIDLTRNYRERLFIYTEENRYPKDHPEYQYMEEQSRSEINIEEQIEEQEFYTSLRAKRVIEKIKRATKFDSVLLEVRQTPET